MADRGVPLYSDGQGEVYGPCEADVGKWEEDGDQVEENWGLLYHGHHLGEPEQDDGQHQVQEVIGRKTQQKEVEVSLEYFSAEQED